MAEEKGEEKVTRVLSSEAVRISWGTAIQQPARENSQQDEHDDAQHDKRQDVCPKREVEAGGHGGTFGGLVA